MAEPEETPAVLNLDSTETLNAIVQALEAYAGTVPDMAVHRVSFSQVPDMTAWEFKATLQCFGDLGDLEGIDPEAPLKISPNLNPKLVFEKTWDATGEGFAGAVEALRDVISADLLHIVETRTNEVEAAKEALRRLHGTVPSLEGIWSGQDPQDDDPEEEPA